MNQDCADKHPYIHTYIFFFHSRLGNAQGPSEYTFLFQGGETAIHLEAVKSFHGDNSKVILIQFLPRILGLVKERAKFNGLQLKKISYLYQGDFSLVRNDPFRVISQGRKIWYT